MSIYPLFFNLPVQHERFFYFGAPGRELFNLLFCKSGFKRPPLQESAPLQ